MRDLVTPQHAWFIVEGRTVLATEPARVRAAVDSGRSIPPQYSSPPSHLRIYSPLARERSAPRAHTFRLRQDDAHSLVSGMQSFQLDASRQPGWARYLRAMRSMTPAQ